MDRQTVCCSNNDEKRKDIKKYIIQSENFLKGQKMGDSSKSGIYVTQFKDRDLLFQKPTEGLCVISCVLCIYYSLVH